MEKEKEQKKKEQKKKEQKEKEPIVMVYYLRKCISCLNKVEIGLPRGYPYYDAECPRCGAGVRIWP